MFSQRMPAMVQVVILVATLLLALVLTFLLRGGVVAAGPLADATGDAPDGLDATSLDVGRAGDEILLVTMDFAGDAWSTGDLFVDSMMVTLTTNGEVPVVGPDTADAYVIAVHGGGRPDEATFNHITDGRSGEVRMDVVDLAADHETLTLFVPLAELGYPDEVRIQVEVGRAVGEGVLGGDRVPDAGHALFSAGQLSVEPVAGPVFDTASVVAIIATAVVALVLLAQHMTRSAPGRFHPRRLAESQRLTQPPPR